MVEVILAVLPVLRTPETLARGVETKHREVICGASVVACHARDVHGMFGIVGYNRFRSIPKTCLPCKAIGPSKPATRVVADRQALGGLFCRCENRPLADNVNF